MDAVNELTQDCIAAVLKLRDAEPDMLPPPELLHQRLRGFVDELIKKGSASFNQSDAQDMAYAVVALLDEIALGKAGPVGEYWMGNLLQFHYFRENLAGDGFFNRLEQVRSDQQRAHVLRVYYLCLLFGFQGRYRVRGGEIELLNLVDEVQQDLARARQLDASDTLSPHAKRPSEGFGGARDTGRLLMVAGAALAVALVVFGGLRMGLYSVRSSIEGEVAAQLAK